jgi:hypothetical protein
VLITRGRIRVLLGEMEAPHQFKFVAERPDIMPEQHAEDLDTEANHALEEGFQQEDNQREHSDGDGGGEATEASGGDSPGRRTQSQEDA